MENRPYFREEGNTVWNWGYGTVSNTIRKANILYIQYSSRCGLSNFRGDCPHDGMRRGMCKEVSRKSFGKDGKRMLSCPNGRAEPIWNTSAGNIVENLRPSSEMYTAEFSPRGSEVEPVNNITFRFILTFFIFPNGGVALVGHWKPRGGHPGLGNVLKLYVNVFF